jgi:hypothetical protein
MAIEAQAVPVQEQKPNDKEYNFRALEAKYQAKLESEKTERDRIARELEELKQKVKPAVSEDEDEDAETYVDHKRLRKKLAKFEEKNTQQTQSQIQQAVNAAIYNERKKGYLDKNPDFYQTIQDHAEKLMAKDPELAETILEMPEGFERQKLVYKSIKAMNLDKPEQKQASIQETVDAKRRNPYYQPSNMNAPPFAQSGDFSPSGQKNAYEKMKQLQAQLRLG